MKDIIILRDGDNIITIINPGAIFGTKEVTNE